MPTYLFGVSSWYERYLSTSTYYTDFEDYKGASDVYENTPTLVGIADVFVNKLGYVWNKKVRKTHADGRRRRRVFMR